MSDHVLADRNSGLLSLQLNRPDKKNALTRAMYSRLAEELEAADADPAIRAVLISGARPASPAATTSPISSRHRRAAWTARCSVS